MYPFNVVSSLSYGHYFLVWAVLVSRNWYQTDNQTYIDSRFISFQWLPIIMNEMRKKNVRDEPAVVSQEFVQWKSIWSLPHCKILNTELWTLTQRIGFSRIFMLYYSHLNNYPIHYQLFVPVPRQKKTDLHVSCFNSTFSMQFGMELKISNKMWKNTMNWGAKRADFLLSILISREEFILILSMRFLLAKLLLKD